MTIINQLTTILIVGIIGTVFGQIPSIGKCPDNVKSVSEFTLSRYLGKWYEYSKYPFIFEAGGKCITADYGMNNDNKVTVLNSQINYITGKPSSISGTAELTTEPGQLLVQFDSVPAFAGTSNYWVLGTDYDNYAVVYSCSELLKSSIHTTVVWILTRKQNPTPGTIEAATKIIDQYELSKKFLIRTTQTDCPQSE